MIPACFASDEVRKQVVHYACLSCRASHTFLATTAGWTGQRDRTETNEMSNSPVAPARTADAHDQPTPQPYSAAPPVEVGSTEVLITEQEVLFGTAAALRVRRRNVSRAERPSPARRGEVPRRYGFLERALMAREMGRL